MPAAPVIHALGARIRLDLDELRDDQRGAVLDAWRDALVADPGDAPIDLSIAVDPRPDTAWLLAALSQRVTREAIDHRRGEGWMLHAGAVADDAGSVVVLVGISGAGKTTAVQALGREVAYVSDETVFIGDDGAVLPYRKPLSVLERRRGPKAERSATMLGMDRPLPPALRVRAIVLLDRRAKSSVPARLDQVDLGDALPALVAQSNYLAAMPRPLRTIARQVAAVGGVVRAVYREASDLAPLVRELLAGDRAAAREEGLPVEVVSPAGSASEARPDPVRYTRAPFDDALALADPDRIAVLHDGVVTVLAGIAPVLWRTADDATPAALTEAAVAALGPPFAGEAPAAESVAAALAELVEAGVLIERVARWRIRADVAWTDDGEHVMALALADWRRSVPLAIGGSGAVIWRELAARPEVSTTALTEAVAAVFERDAPEVSESVAVFLINLEASHLVEVAVDVDANVET